MALTQSNRPVAVSSPLGKDVLLFRRMTASEQLGRMFEFKLDVLSEDDQIKLEDILGQNLTIRLDLPDDETRFFNGLASRFAHVGSAGKYAWYQITLRPWLWFLTRTADCRIFQEKTIPEIIQEVFREHGFTDFEESLSASYRTWNFCVQYRETDFNFVSRLMEQEGIYYYFKHEDGKHTLVLSDSYSAHEKVSAYETVAFLAAGEENPDEKDHMLDWTVAQEVQPGNYALTDFDFEKPKADLAVKSAVSREHEQAEFEIFDYPGEYIETGDGENYSVARIEELQSQHELAHGSSNARGLFAGCLFELAECPREDQNREYLITAATHELEVDGYDTGGGGATTYSNSLTAISSKQQFRPPRTTAKPVVQGPQTAIVVGKSGEEIWTDKYGRVKVQFHWDRYGKADENSSCWVRVAQVWAGKGWGGMQIPRIGQEVIVEFLEGDPDRPIITGRVYNADCMPPYDLPANQTQSGIKSRSTKEGSPENFNEIRFEDKKGEEQLYIHAEMNQDIVVENDETHEIGNDRKKDVGNDETTTIGNDRTESVGNDESVTIGNDRKVEVSNDHQETIGANEILSVGKDRSRTVSDNETIQVGKDHSITIDGERTLTIGKDQSISIAKDQDETIGGQYATTVEKEYSVTAKKINLIAKDELSIQVGKAKLTMKKNGDISLAGKKISLKASGDLVLKGSKITQN